MPPFESPLANASNEEIENAVNTLEETKDLPREKTKIVRLEDIRKPKEEVTELSETDLEEIPEEEIELSEADLEEVPSGMQKAELRAVESKEGEARFTIGASSEASPNHPDRNEDAYYYSAKRGIQFVADGMGGVPAGDYASAAAAEQLTRERIASADPVTKKVFEAGLDTPLEQSEAEQAVQNMIVRMNDAVEQLGKTNETVREKAQGYFKEKLEKKLGPFDASNQVHARVMDALLKQVGCTASLSKVWRDAQGKDHMTVGQVGDSRIYRLRKGNLERLTREDSHVQVLIDEGVKDRNGETVLDDADVTREINAQDIINLAEKRKELAPLAMRLKDDSKERNQDLKEMFVSLDSFRNMITQGVGLQTLMKEQFGTEFKPRVKTVDLEDGDIVLTVSDGVGDNLTDAEIQGILMLNADNPLKAAEELQKAATERSIKGDNPRAKKDDVTALVTKYNKS